MTIKSNADPKFVLWAGDVQSYIAVQEANAKMEEASIEARASSWRDVEDDEGQFDGYDYMVQQIGSTAVVSIHGKLIPQSNWLTRLFGMTGYDEIKNSLVSVINEGSSKSMLLDVNSPGGATEGLEDVASSIKQVNDEFMPVVAHSAGTMASAAYWLGSAAGEVYATKMATVGSIGVVAVHQEISKMLTDQGITTTVLRKGKYKMLGNPLEKLSALAIKVIDDQLAFMYEVFTSSVAENQGLSLAHVQENAAEGQVFFGQEAADLGLLTGVDSFEGVVKRLEDTHNSPNGGSAHQQPMGTEAMLRKKLVISAEARAAIASGVPEADAVAAHPADPAPATPPADPPSAPAVDPAASVETPAEPVADPAAPAAAELTPPAAAPAADNVSLEFMQSQLKATQDELVTAKVALNQAETKLAASEASTPALRAIAIASTQKMQVGLGQTASDMGTHTVEAVIAQHQATEALFNERFHIGATAQQTVEEEGNPSTSQPKISPADTAVTRATAFRQENKT